jgi:hypothetical protein
MKPDDAAERSRLSKERREVLQTIDGAAGRLTHARQQEFNEKLQALVEEIDKLREADGERAQGLP